MSISSGLVYKTAELRLVRHGGRTLVTRVDGSNCLSHCLIILLYSRPVFSSYLAESEAAAAGENIVHSATRQNQWSTEKETGKKISTDSALAKHLLKTLSLHAGFDLTRPAH